MNKLKVIYDVVRKMKDKDSIKGVLMAEGTKDQIKIFEVNNTFEKDIKTGQCKGKTNIEADCNGKKVKIENNIEMQGMEEGNHCCFMKHMHSFHNKCHHEHRGLHDGFKKLTAIFGILGSVKLDEKEDKTVELSLNSADIPEEVKNAIHEKIKEAREQHKHMEEDQHHLCMKQFHDMDDKNFAISILINKDREIEKVMANIKGTKKDEQDGSHDMSLKAELSLG